MAPDLTPQPVVAGVSWPGDVITAADQAKSLGAALGFPSRDCDELALVVTELGSNLIRHASGGTIKLCPLSGGERAGIEIQSVDNGPGIGNVEQAITDGYSTAGGLGLGLGTVNRLMDELEIYPGAGGGLHIVARRWVRAKPGAIAWAGLAFGAATRACRLMAENGDTFLFRQWDRFALAGVIDGLGHGPFAQRASQAARQYIEGHFDQPLENLFLGVGRACRATRGVVMALARFDLDRRNLAVASVGNIEVRLLGSPEPFNLVIRRGILGLNAPHPAVTEHAWDSGMTLVMHSDGISTHWGAGEVSELGDLPPNLVAQRLLLKLGKMDDDATIIVARNAE